MREESFELVDLSALRQELELFARHAASNDERVIDSAPPLLQRLRDLPALEESESTASGWQAVRAAGGEGMTTIVCWNDDVSPELSMSGMWRGEAMQSWVASAGQRYRAWRHAAEGEVRWGSAGEAEGAVKTEVRERARKKFDRWIASHPRRHWRCATCAFENEPEANLCAMCGGSFGAAASPFGVSRTIEMPMTSNSTSSDATMNLPPGLEATFLPEIARSIGAAVSRRKQDARDDFAVLLVGFAPERRKRIIEVLQRIVSGQPEALLGQVPITVIDSIPLDRANEVAKQLCDAGGVIEIRKGP